ncbi:MAG: flagellar protein export ATPase FliI [Dehalobacterium sp.]
MDFSYLLHSIEKADLLKPVGKVTKVVGLTIEAEGILPAIGEICEIYSQEGEGKIQAEVLGFRNETTILMPLDEIKGARPGSQVVSLGKPLSIKVGERLLGKVLNGLGHSFDQKFDSGQEIGIDNSPPNPLTRKPIKKIFNSGVKAVDCFLTCGEGQRIGIFAGSGVGKSTLLGMIARTGQADINIIALVGERGREVKEFIDQDLGPEGLKKSVVVVATSDQPALIRVKAAFVATAIAEYFRDLGKSVMLMMDSVTRFAMAQREIGLAVGEPPTTRGYTPSVFAMLPRLLERSGNSEKGSITALYTVLVEGDDLNEPIADAVRSILDGHIVLTRELANANHFPAVDVLQSVSRLMSQIVSPEERDFAARVRNILSNYQKAEDLIKIGAYVSGTNKLTDEAIKYFKPLNDFLRQDSKEYFTREAAIKMLKNILEAS